MVKIWINGTEYDLTNYVDKASIIYSDTKDESLASGQFVIPFIQENILPEIPRLTAAMIDIGEPYFWLVMEVEKQMIRRPDVFKYTVKVIEPTKILELRTIPDQTITQPKGDISSLVASFNKLTGKEEFNLNVVPGDDKRLPAGYETEGVKLAKSTEPATVLSFTAVGVSNDTNVVEGMQMKTAGKQYTVRVDFTIYNFLHYISSTLNGDVDVTVNVKVGSTVKATGTFRVPRATTKNMFFQSYLIVTPGSTRRQLSFTHTGSGTVTVEMRNTSNVSSTWAVLTNVEIYTESESIYQGKIMLDAVADKVLKTMKVIPEGSTEEQEFILDTSTRARIKTIPSPEFTFTKYTGWDALYEIASYAKAIPYIGEGTTIQEPLTEGESTPPTRAATQMDYLLQTIVYGPDGSQWRAIITVPAYGGWIVIPDIPEPNFIPPCEEQPYPTSPAPVGSQCFGLDLNFNKTYYEVEVEGYPAEYGWGFVPGQTKTTEVGNFKVVHFTFFDDHKEEAPFEWDQYKREALLEQFNSELELNADNVVREESEKYIKREPHNGGWLSVRLAGGGYGQITQENAAVSLSQNIYRVWKLTVKGVPFEMKRTSDDSVVNFAASQAWDITNHVVEKTKYNALINTASYNSRSAALNKGNTVYFTTGNKDIEGLGYNDTLKPPAWNTADPGNLAIVEAILCTAQAANPDKYFTQNYYINPSIHSMQFIVDYLPYSQLRTSISRSDYEDLPKAVRYFNESARVNDAKLLGEYARHHANRMGNESEIYRGIAKDASEVPKINTTKDGKHLVNLTVSSKGAAVEFFLTFTKYALINAYKGTPSAYRQFEVPDTDTVKRTDKYTEIITVGKTTQPVIDSIYTGAGYDYNGLPLILLNFRIAPPFAPAGLPVRAAQVEIDINGDGNYTKNLLMPVDVMATGNTLNMIVQMATNYAAGAKVVETVENGNTIRRQEEVRYTDEFGNMKKMRVTMIANYAPSLTISESRELPDSTVDLSGSLYTSRVAYEVNKDAREIIAFNQELIFHAVSSDIKIYSGFAKYCGMSTRPTAVKPVLFQKGYFPENDSLDLTRIIQLQPGTYGMSSGGLSNSTWIKSPIGQYEGYAIIEESTYEPIYAVRTSNMDSIDGTTNKTYSIYIGAKRK